MEGLLIAVGVVVVLGIPVAAVALLLLAFARASEALRTAEQVRVATELAERRHAGELSLLRRELAELRGLRLAPPATVAQETAAPVALAAPPEVVNSLDHAEELPPLTAVVADVAAEPEPPEPEPAEARSVPPDLLPVPEPPQEEPTTAPPATWEETIGLVWFTRVGAAVLLLGVAYFLKYAVDSDWIGPLGRLFLASLVGASLLAFAERGRGTTKPIFSNVLLGTGLSFFFFSAYASHALYDLTGTATSIAFIALVAIGGGVLAVRHRGEAILVLSTAAALAAPVLLSSGEDRAAALFSYVLVITLLAHAAAVRGAFVVAPWISILGGGVLYLGWYMRYFDTSNEVRGYVQSVGAYAELSSRLAPLGLALGLAGAHLGLFAVTARQATAPGTRGMSPPAYLAAGLLFAHLIIGTLLAGYPGLIMGCFIGLGVLAQGLGKATWLTTLSFFAGSLALAAGAERAAHDRTTSLLLTSLWAAVYVAGPLWTGSRKVDGEMPFRAGPVLLSSLATLVFAALGLVYAGSHVDQKWVRALVLAASAAVSLIVGLLLLRRDARSLANVPLGLSLALLAATCGVLASGFSLTLLWAAVAAVIAVLAAREENDIWLGFSLLLFAAVALHLVAFDVDAPAQARALWHRTQGAEGGLFPSFLLNPRAYALFGTAAACFASSRAGQSAASPFIRRTASFLAAAAHVVLVTLVVTEARSLFFDAPALRGLGHDAQLSAVESALGGQADRLSMVSTLALAGYAAAMLGVGFGMRHPLSRYLGLGLFVIALGKLGLWDIWNLPRVYQISALVGTGALLLGGSYLYARWGKRLVEAFRGD